MKARLKPGVWVKVVWNDSADENQTWMHAEEIDEKPHQVISAGYLVRRTKLFYTLAGDMHPVENGDHAFGRVTRIATGMVVSAQELKAS